MCTLMCDKMIYDIEVFSLPPPRHPTHNRAHGYSLSLIILSLHVTLLENVITVHTSLFKCVCLFAVYHRIETCLVVCVSLDYSQRRTTSFHEHFELRTHITVLAKPSHTHVCDQICNQSVLPSSRHLMILPLVPFKTG